MVPFHNMTHAFNVTHVCYWVLKSGDDENSVFYKSFTMLDKLSMILACIGHDLYHPGLANTYFVKSDH